MQTVPEYETTNIVEVVCTHGAKPPPEKLEPMRAHDERHIHVLLVEDDHETGKTLKRLLERQDMTVTLTTRGEQALELLSDESLFELDPDAFDIVVTDVRMEGMDGVELLKRIRQKAPDFPVILITGYDDFRSVMEAVRYDAQDLILKHPGSVEHLAIPIKKAVHNYRLLVRHRALMRELEQSEARFRDLVALLPEVVWETDDNGRLTFLNQAGLERFGRQPEDIRQAIPLEACFAPEEAGKIRRLLDQCRAGKSVHSVLAVGMSLNGIRFPVLLSAAPIIREEQWVGARGIGITPP